MALYVAPADAMKRNVEPTPEQMEQSLKTWHEWADRCGDQLIDMGNPTINPVSLEGRAMDEDRVVAGFSVVKAQDMNSAKLLFKDHPHLGWAEGLDIELYEIMPL